MHAWSPYMKQRQKEAVTDGLTFSVNLHVHPASVVGRHARDIRKLMD